VEQDLVYGALEETNEYLPLLVFTMLANISVPEAEPTPAAVIDNAWQRKWFYVGAGAIWTPRVYEGEFQSASLYNFGGGVFLEWRDLNILSISAGAEVVQDWIAISAANQKEVKGFVLELPVLVKLVFRPSRYFMLEPYGGVQLNLPLGGDGQVPPFFSITAGLQYCAKAGPGAFFIDGRAAVDMGKSMLEPADSRGFQRFAIKLGVGYKFGFLGQKQRGGE
jgi:hypothetical protein